MITVLIVCKRAIPYIRVLFLGCWLPSDLILNIAMSKTAVKSKKILKRRANDEAIVKTFLMSMLNSPKSSSLARPYL